MVLIVPPKLGLDHWDHLQGAKRKTRALGLKFRDAKLYFHLWHTLMVYLYQTNTCNYTAAVSHSRGLSMSSESQLLIIVTCVHLLKRVLMVSVKDNTKL